MPGPYTDNLAQTTRDTLRLELIDLVVGESYTRRGLAAPRIGRYEVYCIIRAYDANGRYVKSYYSTYPNTGAGSGGHAEEIAIRQLMRDNATVRRVRNGGRLIVVVTQDPCKPDGCRALLRRVARRLNLGVEQHHGEAAERLEVLVPDRQRRPSAEGQRPAQRGVSGRTAFNTDRWRFTFRAVNVFGVTHSLASPVLSEVINGHITDRLVGRQGYDPISPELRFSDESWFMRLARVLAGSYPEGTGKFVAEIWVEKLREQAAATPIGEELVIAWEWPHAYNEVLRKLEYTSTPTHYMKLPDDLSGPLPNRFSGGSPARLTTTVASFPLFGTERIVRGPSSPSLNQLLDPSLEEPDVTAILGLHSIPTWIPNLPIATA